jgi:hypothetical protein
MRHLSEGTRKKHLVTPAIKDKALHAKNSTATPGTEMQRVRILFWAISDQNIRLAS